VNDHERWNSSTWRLQEQPRATAFTVKINTL
jgi:hypothetical protein